MQRLVATRLLTILWLIAGAGQAAEVVPAYEARQLPGAAD